MKKILFITALILSGSGLYAQTHGDTGVRFGLKAGVNITSMTIKGIESGISVSPSNRVGFNFSGILDIPLSPLVYFQPGISISEKGFKIRKEEMLAPVYYIYSDLTPEMSEKTGRYTLRSELRTLYTEVPLNVILKLDAAGGKVLVGAGPYAGYGLSGKAKNSKKTEYPGFEQSEKSEEDAFENGGLSRFDYGLNFLLGYELKSGLFFHGGYGLGLKDAYKESEATSAKHKLFTISAGFLF